MTRDDQYSKYKIIKIFPKETTHCEWCESKINEGIQVTKADGDIMNICLQCMKKGEKKVFKSLRRNYMWFGILIVFSLLTVVGFSIRILSGQPLKVSNWFSTGILILIFLFGSRISYRKLKQLSHLGRSRPADWQAFYREILFGHKIWYFHHMKAVNRGTFYEMMNRLKSLVEWQKNVQERQKLLLI